ncbi:MAG: DUF2892 domain-containing protein [Pseudomonadota bacterium]
MRSNIGRWDRPARLVAGFALVAAAMTGAVGGWAGAGGAVAVITAVIGWCPAHAVLGLDTRCARDRSSAG